MVWMWRSLYNFSVVWNFIILFPKSIFFYLTTFWQRHPHTLSFEINLQALFVHHIVLLRRVHATLGIERCVGLSLRSFRSPFATSQIAVTKWDFFHSSSKLFGREGCNEYPDVCQKSSRTRWFSIKTHTHRQSI